MKIDRNTFQMQEIEYYADFLLVPLYIIFLMHDNTMALRWVAAFVGVGIITWSLFEYFMHRYLFHNTRLFKEQHDDHHRKPKDLVGNPPWVTFAAVAMIWTSLWFLTDYDIASTLTTGVLMGYLFYSEIHMQLHHVEPSGFFLLRRLYAHHSGHHRGGHANFGVSTTLWDHVFRTKR